MIKINLLPADAGKRAGSAAARKSFKLPTGGVLLPGALLALVYLFAVGFAWMAYSDASREEAEVREKTEEKKRKQDNLNRLKKEFDAHSAATREIDEKYEVVQALNPPNRVFWSEKLNMIAKARMDLAVYVTKLTLTEKVDEIETPESVKRRDEWKNKKEKAPGEQEPKAVKRPIINQTLTIEAVAYGTDSPQRLRQVLAFNDNLTSMSWLRENKQVTSFTDGFEPEFGQLPMRVETVAGVEVLKFGFVCKARPQTPGAAPTPVVAPGAAEAQTGKPAAAQGSTTSRKTAGGE